MSERVTINIELPASIFKTLQAAAANQNISSNEACRRLICALPGLTSAELKSLREPAREQRSRQLRLDLDWKLVDTLSEIPRISGLTTSSVFRRLLYALLFTGKIRFTPRNSGTGFRLKLANENTETRINMGAPVRAVCKQTASRENHDQI
jgi:hypothetical protein